MYVSTYVRHAWGGLLGCLKGCSNWTCKIWHTD